MFLAYEKEIGEHIRGLAAQQGIMLSGAEVFLEEKEEAEKKEEAETYGQVKRVVLFLEGEETEAVRETKDAKITISVEEIRLQEPVKAAAGADQVTPRISEKGALNKDSREMEEFVRKVEAYYGLETGNVEVQFQIH